MASEILMPALSPTMEKGKLAKWLVKEGDAVQPGDVIAEIETDKATMEVEAVDEGVIGKIVVAEGSDDVPVNAPIAILVGEGEDAADIKASAAASETARPPASEPPISEPPAPVADSPGAPVARRNGASGGRIFASPLARRIASQKGIDLSAITGSGPHGRIVKRDVEAAPASVAPATPAPTPVAAGSDDAMVRQLFAPDSYDELAHDSMRKVIAERLTLSHQTIPSYLLNLECRLDALLAARAEANAGAGEGDDGKPAFKLSVNDFLIKALALALRDVPMANASWTSTARLIHKHADIGVAVAIADGLITPIVREAEVKPLTAISAEVKDMAGRARNKRLKPEEYQGGTTAISNLGMFGVDGFTSIINPPHASIVSIGAGVRKPVADGDKVALATVMNATFAFDHRVIDGALGAQLAARFRHYVEHPLAMLV